MLENNLEIESYILINFVNLNNNEREMIRCWRNHNDIRKWMYSDKIIDKKQHWNFIENLKRAKDRVYFLVKNKKDNRNMGVISFININFFHKRAYLGIYKNPNEKSKMGDFFGNLIKKVGFEIFRFHTIKVEVIEDNLKAINFYKKIGFSEEGILKDFVYKDNRWKNVIVMGMINPKEEYNNENTKF